MSDTAAPIRRLRKAEETPFSDQEITAEFARELAGMAAFDVLADEYRESAQFRKLLQTHSRVVRLQKGDIVVREGDWGNTAFFILRGKVAVELEPPGSVFDHEVLGLSEIKQRGFWEAISQFWTNHRSPEFRDPHLYEPARRGATGRRGSGVSTRVYLRDVDGVVDRFKTEFMVEGDLFGELAALGRTPRSATVFAVEEVMLLEMRWQGLRNLRRTAASGFRAGIDQRFRERALSSFLREAPQFAHLSDSPETIQEIARGVELLEFGNYDSATRVLDLATQGVDAGFESEPCIALEGHYANGAYLIRNGVARVTRRRNHGHQTVSYLTTGQGFGFEEIAGSDAENVPFQHTLRAIGWLVAIFIPTGAIRKHVIDHPASEWNRKKRKSPRGKSKSARSKEDAKSAREFGVDDLFLEFIVEQRFVNGTATMLIDLDRCTRCDDCVRACASAHDNNPRFLRHGPVHDHIMVANACMHCVDPVCMIECPTGAISRQRLHGEVTINDATCIGCGTCARNCPYEAIRMVEVRDETGQLVHDKHEPIPKATKCDLCVDQWGGPACQRACPHDALARIDLSSLESLSEWCKR